MGCEAGRERRRPVNGVRGGPGEAIEAGSEWGAWRAAGTDRAGPGEAIEAGSEWGARQRGDATEAGRGDRGWSRGGRDLVSELDGLAQRLGGCLRMWPATVRRVRRVPQ